MTPRPTLGAAFQAAIDGGRNLGPRGLPVTLERITAVREDGRVEVAGAVVPTAGQAGRRLRAGDPCALAWKAGRPFVAMAHTARRTGLPPPMGQRLAGFVEDLYIARTPDGVLDVYFRNDQQETALGVGVEADVVFWGSNQATFGIREAANPLAFRVYKLNRDRADASGQATVYGANAAAIESLLYRVDLSASVLFAKTLTFTYSRNCERPVLTGTLDLNPAVVYDDVLQCEDYRCVDNHAIIGSSAFHLGTTPAPPVGLTCPGSGLYEPVATNILAGTSVRQYQSAFNGLARHPDTLDLTRTVGVTVTGLTATYTESVTGTRTGTVTATMPPTFLIDANDDLLVPLRLAFDAFGCKPAATPAGPYTGITGGVEQSDGRYVLPPIPPDTTGHLPYCPFNTITKDPDGTEMGVNPFAITETHSLMVRARTGAAIWSTLLDGDVTRAAVHTRAGEFDFGILVSREDYGLWEITLPRSRFIDVYPSQPICTLKEDTNDIGESNWWPNPATPAPPSIGTGFFNAISSGTVGEVGHVGYESVERTLFAALGWLPALDLSATTATTKSGFLAFSNVDGDATVATGGFEAHYFDPSITHPPNARLGLLPTDPVPTFGAGGFYHSQGTVFADGATYTKVDVAPIYRREVLATPFAINAAGDLYQFVVVRDVALRPATAPNGEPVTGHDADPTRLSAFVLAGHAIKATLLDQVAIPFGSSTLPVLLTANSQRVLWSLDGAGVFLTNYRGDQTTVTTGAPSAATLALRLTEPDFLYDHAEADRYFVQFRNDQGTALQLVQAATDYPPTDVGLPAYLGALLDVQDDPPGASLVVQTINDPAVVPPDYQEPRAP